MRGRVLLWKQAPRLLLTLVRMFYSLYFGCAHVCCAHPGSLRCACSHLKVVKRVTSGVRVRQRKRARRRTKRNKLECCCSAIGCKKHNPPSQLSAALFIHHLHQCHDHRHRPCQALLPASAQAWQRSLAGLRRAHSAPGHALTGSARKHTSMKPSILAG